MQKQFESTLPAIRTTGACFSCISPSAMAICRNLRYLLYNVPLDRLLPLTNQLPFFCPIKTAAIPSAADSKNSRFRLEN